MNSPLISPLCIRNGFAYGWAVAEGRSSLEVHLWMDGRDVATEHTGAAVPAFCHKACGAPPHPDAGFVFALPAAALDGFPHDLHASVAVSAGDNLHGQVQCYEHSDARGEVMQQGRQYVGTVWFKRRPEQEARLDIRGGDGKSLLQQPLTVSALPGKHGYEAQFAVPCEELPRGPLHFSCRGQLLRGSPCSRTASIIGMLEEVAPGGVRGWAFDSADTGRPIELCLRVDGRPVAWFRPNMRRPELESRLGRAPVGLIGFHVPLPEETADGRVHRVEVVAADDGRPLSGSDKTVRIDVPWVAPPLISAGCGPSPIRAPRKPAAAVAQQRPIVSVVVLTRNGEAMLAAFLESWEQHNRSVSAEIIVVDHASVDGSLALLRAWQSRLDLHVIALDRNDSFSSSCNRGARRARADHLLFMNNDIVWLQDALPAMLETLHQDHVGVVGLKLLKAVGESDQALQPATEVQHLGIRFKLNEAGYWPYEAAPSRLRREYEYDAQVVPAVTGAVLLCRKSDFEAVGGFDERYFYGFEDVELCLRLSQRLGRVVVSRNDLCALHHHGHTRMSGRELALFDRVQRNADVLESQAGLWLKQAYWRSLLQGDGFITTDTLTIGVVVDSAPGGKEMSLLAQDALKLAGAIKESLPHARVVLLPPERGWKDAAELHVLIVGTTAYDIRALHGTRADLLTVAWVRSDAAGWSRVPWWNDFGACLSAPSGPSKPATAAAPLGALLDPARWRLRTAVRVPLAAAELDGDSPLARQAHRLARDLKRAGVPCWMVPADGLRGQRLMVDVSVTLHAGGQAHDWPLRSSELNVLWLCGAVARPPAKWNAGYAHVTRERPSAEWLHRLMGESVASAFPACPPR